MLLPMKYFRIQVGFDHFDYPVNSENYQPLFDMVEKIKEFESQGVTYKCSLLLSPDLLCLSFDELFIQILRVICETKDIKFQDLIIDQLNTLYEIHKELVKRL